MRSSSKPLDRLPRFRSVARDHSQARVLVPLLAVSAALGVLSVNAPLVGVGTAIVVASLVLPRTVIVLSVSWVVLCRPGLELVHIDVAGFSLTETDALLLASLLAWVRLRSQRSGTPYPAKFWLVLFAWPIWMLIRAALPPQGLVQFASPFVDLHLLLTFMFALPISALIQANGRDWGVRWLCTLGYVACVVSIASWLGNTVGLLPYGQFALVDVSPGPLTARPGGELLIPVLAVLLALGKAPLALKSRAFSIALVLGQVLVSQTLSIVLAIAAGIFAGAIANWSSVRPIARVLLVVILATVALVASGLVGADSRFNLSERGGEDSAQYRVSEFAAVSNIIERVPTVLLVGTGPGSVVQFEGLAIHEIKRDTHNVLLTVVLKSGLIGAVLFVLPVLSAGAIAFKNRRRGMSSYFGAIAAIVVVSISVPFLWTSSGLLVAILLWLSVSREPDSTTIAKGE